MTTASDERGRLLRAVVGMALLAGLVAACGAVPLETYEAARVAVASAHGVGEAEAAAARRLSAATAAASVVHAAVPAVADAPFRRTAFLAAVAGGDMGGAARLREVWLPSDGDVKVAFATARFQLGIGALDAARSTAWQAMEAAPASRRAFMALWLDAWTAEPTFVSPIVRLEPGGVIDRVRALGGGSTLTYRLDSGGMTLAAFKPNQTRLQSSFRAEIAAYRLCALIHCAFEVPHNRELRVDRATWYALWGATTRSEQQAVDARGRDLVWTRDSDGVEWLHGTAKSWVVEFRLFGIERAERWRGLVSRDAPAEFDVARLMGELLSGRLSTGVDGITAPSLARQLSNLHVFDYLLNNWDRYSGAFPGVNCQWSGDHFVSIDNGAGFPDPRIHGVLNGRVRNNLARVEVFSRRTIDAIRWMDTDRLFGVLFPPSPASDIDKRRYQAFLARRERLLAHVDGLVERYGAEVVYGFP